MSAAKVQLSCSFRHLCSASSFPVGNYLFPVVIIIPQHAADPISDTSHFHLQPAGFSLTPCSTLYAPNPPSPGAGVKGTDLLQRGWRWREREKRQKGDEGRREGGKNGKAWDGHNNGGWMPSHATPTHLHKHGHILCFLPLFSKGRMPGRICDR